jgi:MscS family membrane protein
MKDFFDQVILSNTVRDYCIVGGVILLAFFLKKYVGRYFSGIFYFTMRQFGRQIDKKEFADLVFKPIETFLFFTITYIALSSLKFPKILYFRFLKTDTNSLLETIGIIILILTFFRMLLRVVDYFASVLEKKADLTAELTDNQLVLFFKDLLKALLVILGFLMILRFAFDQNITKILAGLSIVGVAVALAARESLENLIASFIIFFDKPFSTGDLLKVNNITGTVEKIGLRSTRIRTTEKTFVTVPNKQMVDSVVDNLSQRTQRRVELKLELDLNSSPEQVQQALNGIEVILNNPLIVNKTVLLSDITPEAFLITCEYFTLAIAIGEFNNIKQQTNLQIISLLRNLDIEIAGAGKDIKIVKA